MFYIIKKNKVFYNKKSEVRLRKISIIVPIYNSEKTLQNCIESLLSQSYKNIEIILVNDGSNDGTEKSIKDKYISNSQIKYYRQNNYGVSKTRNYGIIEATGDYIFFMDADDILDKTVIENLVNNLNKNELICISSRIINNNKKVDNCYKKSEYTRDELIHEILLGNILGVVWGYLFETNIIKKMEFDEKTGYLEDTIFLIEYLKKSKINKIHYIDNGGYYNYIINDNGITSKKNNVLKKCIDFNYSLNKINVITENKYTELIENKKIIMLEKEMRLINQETEFKKVYDLVKIKKYQGKNIRLKYFNYIYINKKNKSLILYYKFRNVMKKIIGILK